MQYINNSRHYGTSCMAGMSVEGLIALFITPLEWCTTIRKWWNIQLCNLHCHFEAEGNLTPQQHNSWIKWPAPLEDSSTDIGTVQEAGGRNPEEEKGSEPVNSASEYLHTALLLSPLCNRAIHCTMVTLHQPGCPYYFTVMWGEEHIILSF